VELERCPIGEGDGKAGIENGSFDIEEKRSSGRSKEGRGNGETARDDEFDGNDDDRRVSRGEGY